MVLQGAQGSLKSNLLKLGVKKNADPVEYVVIEGEGQVKMDDNSTESTEVN